MLKGAGGKAFCAGGDIKTLYEAKKTGDPQRMEVLDEFFRKEFTLDYLLSQMNPAQVALWDGIVMGGGVGISIFSKIKIATETTTFAMPEAKIGFFTDVGGSYFLSRMRSNLGFYLALTGQRLKGKELVQVGLADFFIKKDDLPKAEEELMNSGSIIQGVDDMRNILSKYEETVEKEYANEEAIKKIFAKSTLVEIMQDLSTQQDNELSAKILKSLKEQCPMSLCVIFEQIKRGKNLGLAECFKMDFRLTQR